MTKAANSTTSRRNNVQVGANRKSKRAAALQAERQAEPLFGSVKKLRNGHGISDFAVCLADLQRLYSTMDRAATMAKRRAREAEATIAKGSCADSLNPTRAHTLFRSMESRAWAKLGAVEELILELEPTTKDETLTLMAILWEEIDGFVTDNCSDNQPSVTARWATIERGIKAAIRGLVASGATSPVLGYYMTPQDLVSSWYYARATALAEARDYPDTTTADTLVAQARVTSGQEASQ
jgi:hypothetical protein